MIRRPTVLAAVILVHALLDGLAGIVYPRARVRDAYKQTADKDQYQSADNLGDELRRMGAREILCPEAELDRLRQAFGATEVPLRGLNEAIPSAKAAASALQQRFDQVDLGHCSAIETCGIGIG